MRGFYRPPFKVVRTRIIVKNFCIVPKSVQCSGSPIICCHLDGLDIVRVQFEVRLPALVEGRHHRAVHVAVGQPQAVAQLVGQRLQQVRTLEVSMVS